MGLIEKAGGGFSPASIIGFSLYGEHNDGVTASVTNYSFADMNNDGLVDLVSNIRSSVLRVRYNRGGSLGRGDDFLFGEEHGTDLATCEEGQQSCWNWRLAFRTGVEIF